VHTGPHTDIDRAYGTLATYVTQHALGVDGPIREYYLVGAHEASDESEWRTEIGWPIFQTGRSADRPTESGTGDSMGCEDLPIAVARSKDSACRGQTDWSALENAFNLIFADLGVFVQRHLTTTFAERTICRWSPTTGTAAANQAECVHAVEAARSFCVGCSGFYPRHLRQLRSCQRREHA
jgi:hypothetical protein